MEYRDGYDGQIIKDEIFQLPKELWPYDETKSDWITITINGKMTVKKGFCWDYATVPFTHWLSNKIAGKKSKTPSLGHDALCKLKRNGLLPQDPTRIHTDKYFHQLLLDRKFWKVRAWAWYKAVRFGAKYHKQKPKKVHEAP
jgi:hypothetical protein